MSDLSPNRVIEQAMARAPRILRFDREAYLPEWQSAARRTLKQLLGVMPQAVDLNVEIVRRERHAGLGCEEIELTFVAERDCVAHATLLLPAGASAAKPVPAMICLQGHSTGAHISLGRKKFAKDEELLKGDRDFAVQAVKRGYAALALEQRGFGTRSDTRGAEVRHANFNGCHHLTMTSLLVGRTMLGQRVWDVLRAIDVLTGHFAEVDASRINLMGQSGGGTVSYYAAAYDQRISAVMPSCSVCTFAASIGAIDHCADNYVPNIMHYFEMSDIAGLIAPRPLVVVAGETDDIFPVEAVKRNFDEIAEIYEAFGAAEKCGLVIGNGGHQFYADAGWLMFERMTTPR